MVATKLKGNGFILIMHYLPAVVRRFLKNPSEFGRSALSQRVRNADGRQKSQVGAFSCILRRRPCSEAPRKEHRYYTADRHAEHDAIIL